MGKTVRLAPCWLWILEPLTLDGATKSNNRLATGQLNSQEASTFLPQNPAQSYIWALSGGALLTSCQCFA